jgi:NADH-quinone oxidoreductase subunit L
VPVAWFDRHIVDGTMNTIATVTQVVSFRIRGFQSGQMQKYAFVFISAAVALVVLLIYLWI